MAMMCLFSHRFRGFVIATLTIALLFVGFAHRMPTPAETALQSYVAAGGSLVGLCHDANDDTPQAQGGGCPVCHLTATCLLPDAEVDLRPAAKVLAFDPPALVSGYHAIARLDHVRASRAPPATA